jgi:hypothetical protein
MKKILKQKSRDTVPLKGHWIQKGGRGSFYKVCLTNRCCCPACKPRKINSHTGSIGTNTKAGLERKNPKLSLSDFVNVSGAGKVRIFPAYVELVS